jgi:hypothetical protein
MKLNPKQQAFLLRILRAGLASAVTYGGLDMLQGSVPITSTALRALGTGVLYAIIRTAFTSTPGMVPLPPPLASDLREDLTGPQVPDR